MRVRVSEGIAQGQVFRPMHHAETNMLTLGVFDPYSRQPAFKYAAAAVRAVTIDASSPRRSSLLGMSVMSCP